ncbi:hypothetical protein MLD38_028679 [Melastoma candidum]|uniref:Uncharacterized protein n=1 Tax=Melastoma candidum TaxID=119954 RepID=A0ACB9N1E8_9MYRT|nr:hypothetical protein MLD38_028679 [Melastoma candidum]
MEKKPAILMVMYIKRRVRWEHTCSRRLRAILLRVGGFNASLPRDSFLLPKTSPHDKRAWVAVFGSFAQLHVKRRGKVGMPFKTRKRCPRPRNDACHLLISTPIWLLEEAIQVETERSKGPHLFLVKYVTLL